MDCAVTLPSELAVPFTEMFLPTSRSLNAPAACQPAALAKTERDGAIMLFC